VAEDDILKELNRLRLALKSFMTPEVLDKFASLMDNLGNDGGLVERYAFFAEHSENGPDCRYARMAKHLFVEENGDNVVEIIKWLYHNWAKHQGE
jgi:hypothetical protein